MAKKARRRLKLYKLYQEMWNFFVRLLISIVKDFRCIDRKLDFKLKFQHQGEKHIVEIEEYKN